MKTKQVLPEFWALLRAQRGRTIPREVFEGNGDSAGVHKRLALSEFTLSPAQDVPHVFFRRRGKAD